jgi:hypothetical protein
MTSLRTRELGSHRARCACCGADAVLLVVESRLHRVMPIGRFDPQVSRTASCSACRQTYPIRATDDGPTQASARAQIKTGRHRERAVAEIGAGRDWAYPESA